MYNVIYCKDFSTNRTLGVGSVLERMMKFLVTAWLFENNLHLHILRRMWIDGRGQKVELRPQTKWPAVAQHSVSSNRRGLWSRSGAPWLLWVRQ